MNTSRVPPLLCLFPTQFRAKIDFSRQKENKIPIVQSPSPHRHCRAYMPDCTLAGPPWAKCTVMGGQQVCNLACRPCNDGGVTVTTQ